MYSIHVIQQSASAGATNSSREAFLLSACRVGGDLEGMFYMYSIIQPNPNPRGLRTHREKRFSCPPAAGVVIWRGCSVCILEYKQVLQQSNKEHTGSSIMFSSRVQQGAQKWPTLLPPWPSTRSTKMTDSFAPMALKYESQNSKIETHTPARENNRGPRVILVKLSCVSVFEFSRPLSCTTRPIGWLIFMGHFQQKSPIISGSFAESDLQRKSSYGSSPLSCTTVFVRSFCRGAKTHRMPCLYGPLSTKEPYN